MDKGNGLVICFFFVGGEGGSFKDEFEGGLNLDLYVQGKIS